MVIFDSDTKQWVSELEMSFRSFLLKLNVIGTSLDPLPKGRESGGLPPAGYTRVMTFSSILYCTFGIEVHTSIESGSNLQTANEVEYRMN